MVLIGSKKGNGTAKHAKDAKKRPELHPLGETRGHSFVLRLLRALRFALTARGWLKRLGHGLDGIVAKRLDQPYRPGKRATQTYKLWQTVDCGVGGIDDKRGTRRPNIG